MPWELGFFDGTKGRVALLPVVQVDVNSYHGSEYLGLYPYITTSPTNLIDRTIPACG